MTKTLKKYVNYIGSSFFKQPILLYNIFLSSRKVFSTQKLIYVYEFLFYSTHTVSLYTH